MNRRVAITGMSINTPLGDTLDGFLAALLRGRSAITRWKSIDSGRIYSKVGGDLSEYNVSAKLEQLTSVTPPDIHKRLRKLVPKSPFSTRLTSLVAVDAWHDAGFDREAPALDK